MLHTRLPLRTLQGCKPPALCPVLTCRSYSTRLKEQGKTQQQWQQPKQQGETDPSQAAATDHLILDNGFRKDKGGIKLRKYVPRTPGTRHVKMTINDHLWKGRPVQKLTFPKKGHGKGGRNSVGRIVVRHRGGGHKRRIRIVDFDRMAPGPHRVERIERDPGRTGHIALLTSLSSKEQSYILAAEGMRAGDIVESYRAGIPDELWQSMGGAIDPGVLAARTARRGNCLPLHMVPVGTLIYNVGLKPQKGGQLCRGAGTHATVVARQVDLPKNFDELMEFATQSRSTKNKGNNQNAASQGTAETPAEGDSQVSESKPGSAQSPEALPHHISTIEEMFMANKKLPSEQELRHMLLMSKHVTIRLQSGETRLLHMNCCATIGSVSNPDYKYTQLGKAGRSRWLNIRPTVRGVAMNAMDHPHGGGRGKSKGNVDPKSPWGVPAKSGFRTRPKWRVNKAVVIPRVRNQGKRRRGYH